MDTVRQLKHRIKNIKWKNVKRTASIAKGKAVSKVKDFYMTDFENRVRKATSNRNWSVGLVELTEIAQYSYNPLLYKIMMEIVYSRLKDKGRNWRRVYKALELIRIMLFHGAPGVLLDMQHNVHVIESLENFRYVHPKTGKDVGQNVRYKAKQVADLIRDRRLLEKEREQSRAMLDKISQSKRVAYSSNASYSNNSKPPMEEGTGERISQRRIVASNDSSVGSSTDLYSNHRYFSSSQNKRDAMKVTIQDTDPSSSTQDHKENDLLLLDDIDQDDEASVSEDSCHVVEGDEDFGEFVESFSNVKLEQSSTKDTKNSLPDLGFSEKLPSLQQSDVRDKPSDLLVTNGKDTTNTTENMDKNKLEDNSSFAKKELDASSNKETNKMGIPHNLSTSRQVTEDNEDDPFGQLVSEWINSSHSSYHR